MVEEEKPRMNPEGPTGEKKINTPELPPTITAGDVTIPHIGKKKTKPLDLFGTGPNRGGSLGNFRKK